MGTSTLLASSARRSTTPSLSLTGLVALAALERDSGDTAVFRKLCQGELMRLFQFLYCERLRGRGRPAFGHLCTARRACVRYGTSRFVMLYGDEELSVDVALVGRLSSWADDVCRGTGERMSLPLPPELKVHANAPVATVAPVTRAGQVLAVLPEVWGEAQTTANLVSSARRLNCRPTFQWNTAVRLLERIEEMLNRKGECAVVRTHQLKIHVLTAAQAKVAAASSYNPSLSKVLNALGVEEARLYAIVYLQRDPGFFCFN